MEEKRSKTEFFGGDLVFAKMKSFPPWPAKVLSNEEAPATPANKMAVLFFGTNELGYLKPQDLYDYVEFRQKFSVAKKVKGFNEGLAQIAREAGLEFSLEPSPNKAPALVPTVTEEEPAPEQTVPEEVAKEESSKRARKPKTFNDFVQIDATVSNRKRKPATADVTPKRAAPRNVEEVSDQVKLESVENSDAQAEKSIEVIKSPKKSTATKKKPPVIKSPVPAHQVDDEDLKTQLLADLAAIEMARPTLPPVIVEAFQAEPEHQIPPPTYSCFSTPPNLPEKRIRKKKVFSDDFVSPDLILTATKPKPACKPEHPLISAVKPKHQNPLKIKRPTVSVVDDEEMPDTPNLVIDEDHQQLQEPLVAKVAPLKIKLFKPSTGHKKKHASMDSAQKRESLAEKNATLVFGQGIQVKSEVVTPIPTAPRILDGITVTASAKPKKPKPVLKINLLQPAKPANLSAFIKNKTKKIFSHVPAKKPSLATTKLKKLAAAACKRVKMAEAERKLHSKKTGLPLSYSKSARIRLANETEEEYKRRRRMENRLAKQSSKLKKVNVTAYSYWSSIEMEKLVKEQPDLLDFQEIRLVLQNKWRDMPNEEKERYRILAKMEKEKRIAALGGTLSTEKSYKDPKTDTETETEISVMVTEERDNDDYASTSDDEDDEGRSALSIDERKMPKSSSSAWSTHNRVKSEYDGQPPPKRGRTAKLDPETQAVLMRRQPMGPVEARARWWLYSTYSIGPGRRRVARDYSPPRAITAELLDATAAFRMMSKSFEQMGKRLLKFTENNPIANAAFIDSLLDGLMVSMVHLLGVTKEVYPLSLAYPKENVLDLMEKTLFMTPI